MPQQHKTGQQAKAGRNPAESKGGTKGGGRPTKTSKGTAGKTESKRAPSGVKTSGTASTGGMAPVV
jgi:hypothetical protein